MNNKEFISKLSEALKIDSDRAVSGTAMLTQAITDLLSENEGTVLKLKNFGNFEIRKRDERFAMNPSTGKKMLVPPKLTIVFRPSPSLRDRIVLPSEKDN